MKIKTQDLIGPALDWAVARAIGLSYVQFSPERKQVWAGATNQDQAAGFFSPSTDWSQGGPIIERESINSFRYHKLDPAKPDVWCAHKVVPRPNMEGSTNMVAISLDGSTLLIAAMRCYVAGKLGDEVDVPVRSES